MTENAPDCVEQPCLPRYRKLPKRLDSGEENYRFSDEKTFYRVHYFSAIDSAVSELERRLGQEALEIPLQMEQYLISMENSEKVKFSQALIDMYHRDIDVSKLEQQVKLFPDLVVEVKERIAEMKTLKKITNVRTIGEIFVKGNTKIFTEIEKLLCIYLTIPVTTSTAERSFSTLRRLKNYLRTTMVQERLNNLLLLHVHKSETDTVDMVEIAKLFIRANESRMKYFGDFDS